MLSHWFNPLPNQIALLANRFCEFKHEDGKDFPFIDTCQLAIIGFDENISNSFRENFFNFENHTPNLKIADLGNLKKSDVEFVLPAIKEIIDSGIIPIVLGAPAHIIQKLSHRLQAKTIHQISNRIPDYHSDDQYEIIGFQRHLCSLNKIYELEEVSKSSMSLANMRANPSIHEAIMRDASIVHFDGNVIKLADNPASMESNTSGLTCAEACQTMKYIGGSHHLQLLNITNQETLNLQEQNASRITMAEMVWYFLEGISQRLDDHPTKMKNQQKFVINSLDRDSEIVFTKNILTGRWWFEASANDAEYIACSIEEYNEATQGEIPNRLLRYIT